MLGSKGRLVPMEAPRDPALGAPLLAGGGGERGGGHDSPGDLPRRAGLGGLLVPGSQEGPRAPGGRAMFPAPGLSK